MTAQVKGLKRFYVSFFDAVDWKTQTFWCLCGSEEILREWLVKEYWVLSDENDSKPKLEIKEEGVIEETVWVLDEY